MISQLWKYIAAIAGAATIGVYIWSNIQMSQLESDIEDRDVTITKLAEKISKLDASIGSLRNDKATLTNAIDRQNIMIEKQATSLVLKEKEISAWEAKPDGEKYKKWYDRLKDIDMSKTKCERYIDVENATSGFDLDAL